MHALHLQSVADIDAGGTRLHTGATIDAIPRLRIARLAGMFARFATDIVVRHDDRLSVDEGSLPATVGTYDETRLFPEVGKVEPHDSGEQHNEEERRRVFRGRIGHPAIQLIRADEEGEQRVRHEKRHREEREIFRDTARREPRVFLVEIPRAGVATVEPTSDRTKQELEVHGLRTGPAAPRAPEERGDEEDADDATGHDQHEQERIGGQEGVSHQRELTPRQVHQKHGFAKNAQVWRGEERRHQQIGHEPSLPPPCAMRWLGADPAARPVFVERREHAPRWCHSAHGVTGTPCGAFGLAGFDPCNEAT